VRPVTEQARSVAGAVPILAVSAVLLGTGAQILPPDALIDAGPVQMSLARLLIVLGLVCLVVAEGARGELFRTRLEIPLALLLAASTASTIEWGTEPRLRFLIESIALFYLVVGVVRARPESRTALSLIALLALALAAFGGIEQISQGVLTGFYRDGCTPITLPPGIQPPPGAVTRATGAFSNPNVLAGAVLLLAPLAAVTSLAVTRAAQMRLALGLVAGLGYLALFLTYSRTGVLIGIVGAGAAILFAGTRYRWPLVAVGATLAIGFTFLFASCGSDAGAGYGRSKEWSDTITIIKDNPVYGVGLGRVGQVLQARNPSFTAQHAHNLYLNWWAEAGPAALVAWLWMFGYLVFRSGRAALRGDPLARGLAVALGGFALFSLTDHPANVDRVATTLWVVMGLAAGSLAMWRKREAAGEPEPGSVSGQAAALPATRRA
jgi:O-antigen ligase